MEIKGFYIIDRLCIKTMNISYLLAFSRQMADSKILLLIPVHLKVHKVICDEPYTQKGKRQETLTFSCCVA
jgi:hypothetical protein